MEEITHSLQRGIGEPLADPLPLVDGQVVTEDGVDAGDPDGGVGQPPFPDQSTITSPECPQREWRTSFRGWLAVLPHGWAPPGPQMSTGSPSGGTTT